MAITTIRPSTDPGYLTDTFTNGIGAGTHVARVSDNSDTTSIRSTGGVDDAAYRVPNTYTTPAGSYIRRVRLCARLNRSTINDNTGMFIGDSLATYTWLDQYGNPHIANYNSIGGTFYIDAPSGTITTYQGAWVTSANGTAFTDSIINTLTAHIECIKHDLTNNAYTDVIDVYDVWFEVETNALPTATVTAPTGNVTTTTRPTIVTTYNDSDGDSMSLYNVKIFSAAQYGAGGFDPAVTTPIWQSGLTSQTVTAGGSFSVTVGTDLTNGTTYKAYVMVAQATDNMFASSYAIGPAFTISLDAPAQPVLTATADDANARITLAFQGRDNLLTADLSSFETSVTGWTGTNATLSRITSQFLDGVASMQLASVAAGTMYANTATGTGGLPVIPGIRYSAMASFRRVSATADRAISVAIGWYNAAGTLLYEITSNGTVNSTNTGWTQRTVVGVAPGDAAFAHVRVYVTGPTAAAEQFAVDTVCLAPQAPNLLKANDASLETDVSGWSLSNCTAARSTSQALVGSASLALTANGAGDASANVPGTGTPEGLIQVRPGQMYYGSAYVRAATIGRTTSVILRFWDATIAASTDVVGTASVDTTTGWTKYTVVGQCPTNRVFVQLVAYITAPANGEVHYVDAVQVQQLANMLTYNQESVETDTTGIFAWGNVTVTRITSQAFLGSASAQAASLGVTTGGVANILNTLVLGKTYRITAAFRRISATADRNCSVLFYWMDVNNNLIRQDVSPTQLVNNTAWTVISLAAIPPANAVSCYAAYQFVASGAGEQYAMDQMMVSFDPSNDPWITGADFLWTLGGYNATTSTYIIEKSTDGGVTWAAVRGGSGIAGTGTPANSQQATIYDYEALPGKSVAYRARVTGLFLGLTVASPNSPVVNATSNPTLAPATGWILKDPLDPTQNQTIDFMGDQFDTSMKEEQAVYMPLGRTRPVVVSDVVRGEDGTLKVECDTLAKANAFEAIRNKQHVLLLQRFYSNPEQWYIRLGADMKRIMTNHSPPLYRYEVSYVEVDAP